MKSKEVKEFHVISDAFGGQNRNYTVTILHLAMKMKNRFSVIHHYFPVQGPSVLPCNQDFSVIKLAICRFDQNYVPSQYQDIIRTDKKFSLTYKVKSVHNEGILNLHE